VSIYPIALLAAAFVLSWLITHAVLRASRTAKIFMGPSSRSPQKIHKTPTPRSGGVGIFAGCFLLLGCGWGFGASFIAAGFFAFLGGILEDLTSALTPQKRLLAQVLSALVFLALFRLPISDLGGGIILPLWAGVAFTIFAVVGVINSINIIDGFNGLAGGIAAMVLASLGAAAWMVGDAQLSAAALIIACATLGFLALNFPSGRIFLGDGGAYFLGFCIAAISILLVERNDGVSAWFALAITILPVFEVVFSIFRRKLRGLKAMQPDKLHLHTLIFRRLTHANAPTSAAMFVLAAPFVYLPLLYMANTKALIATILAFVACYLMIYKALTRPRRRKRK
jgi:UDP-N-acetylmuramyl pentapeptide phosphotransferase/UDP-N-acetylglucosamine-1-phosphate transferase